MNDNSPLASKILELINIFRKSFNSEKGTLEIPMELKSKFSSLHESILNDLVWSPGTPIYLNDPSELKAFQTAIDVIWENVDSKLLFEEMTSGGYSGLLVSIIGDYTDRVKMLKPTFVSINPKDTDFYIYFNEAMKAWLFGLNNASLILCCSILETTLKQNLNKSRVENHRLETLIDKAAKAKLLNNEEKAIAHDIRKLRNNAIHGLCQVSYNNTFGAIMNTKKLVERLLAPVSEF